MIWKSEWKSLVWIVSGFLVAFFLPIGAVRFDNAILEAFHLVKWYAQEHVILCLVPAFFIAGAIAVFISQDSVMKYLGPTANKFVSYGVSSVSGSVLAVCSCTVLPLFSGIYRMGAGIGPATAFLYSGPAINVLAIILTARILGAPLGIARAVGAVLFAIIIGLIMHFLFRKEEAEKKVGMMAMPVSEVKRPLWQNGIFFALMVAILVFANWGKPDGTSGFWYEVYSQKWLITGIMAIGLAFTLYRWIKIKIWKLVLVAIPVIIIAYAFPAHPLIAFAMGAVGLGTITSTGKGEAEEWFGQTWDFTKQILPMLLFGVLIAGLLLGRPGGEGIIPSGWVDWAVGGNSLWSNLFASVVGAFMYFATLTEIPILQGLIGNGMGNGPALALLLAGPALSLPNMLVIRSVMGNKKTIAFVSLVIIMSAISGMIFGSFY
ncbi:permease [bacterium]|nr:permease [bacterium]